MEKNKANISTLVVLVLFLSACTVSQREPVKESRFLLDTVIEITLYEKETTARAILNEMFNEIQSSELKYSRHVAGSEISRINNNPGEMIEISEDTVGMLEKSLNFSALSNGLFDISIGPLVDLWDIGGEDPHVPSSDAITAVLKKIDYRKVFLDIENHKASIIDDGMSLDTGAIAKGYITDKLVSYLLEKGVESALLNLGGNLYLHGNKTDGSAWNVGIRNPYGLQGEYLGTVSVSNMSVVTSGIYERFFLENQKRYHHILNPKTGYPAGNGLASVSILSSSSTLADGFSTTVFLLGPEAGMALIEKTEDAEAILVTMDKKVFLSSGIKNGEIPFHITDNEFTIAN